MRRLALLLAALGVAGEAAAVEIVRGEYDPPPTEGPAIDLSVSSTLESELRVSLTTEAASTSFAAGSGVTGTTMTLNLGTFTQIQLYEAGIGRHALGGGYVINDSTAAPHYFVPFDAVVEAYGLATAAMTLSRSGAGLPTGLGTKNYLGIDPPSDDNIITSGTAPVTLSGLDVSAAPVTRKAAMIFGFVSRSKFQM